jgi:hypothetical protein
VGTDIDGCGKGVSGARKGSLSGERKGEASLFDDFDDDSFRDIHVFIFVSPFHALVDFGFTPRSPRREP